MPLFVSGTLPSLSNAVLYVLPSFRLSKLGRPPCGSPTSRLGLADPLSALRESPWAGSPRGTGLGTGRVLVPVCAATTAGAVPMLPGGPRSAWLTLFGDASRREWSLSRSGDPGAAEAEMRDKSIVPFSVISSNTIKRKLSI